MTYHPRDLPDGTVVSFGMQHGNRGLAWVDGGELFEYPGGGAHAYGLHLDYTFTPFVPVPDGMTYADAKAALADAGAWVEVATSDVQQGARTRIEFEWGNASQRTWVHRDDLPPTDPDADLIEKMARAIFSLAWPGRGWEDMLPDHTKDRYRKRARSALAVVREHEAKS